MLGHAVVPHQEIANAPVVPVTEFRSRNDFTKFLDKGQAFLVRHAVNADALAFAHVDGLASGHGMGPNYRMLDVPHVLDRIGELAAGSVFLGPGAVDRAQASELFLHLRRQRVVSSGGTGKYGVTERAPILDWNFAGVEQRSARRRLRIGHVRVPASALPIGLPSMMMFERTRISGWPGRANWVRGLTSSSPNKRENAICCSGVSFWPRKTSTE